MRTAPVKKLQNLKEKIDTLLGVDERILTLTRRAVVAESKKEYQSALQIRKEISSLASQALKVAKEIPLEEDEGETLDNRYIQVWEQQGRKSARSLEKMGNYPQGAAVMEYVINRGSCLLPLFDPSKDMEREKKDLEYLGRLFLKMGNIKRAVNSFVSSKRLDLAEKILRDLPDLKKTTLNFNVDRDARFCKSLFGEDNFCGYVMLAEMYASHGMHDKAGKVFEEAYADFTRNDPKNPALKALVEKEQSLRGGSFNHGFPILRDNFGSREFLAGFIERQIEMDNFGEIEKPLKDGQLNLQFYVSQAANPGFPEYTLEYKIQGNSEKILIDPNYTGINPYTPYQIAERFDSISTMTDFRTAGVEASEKIRSLHDVRVCK